MKRQFGILSVIGLIAMISMSLSGCGGEQQTTITTEKITTFEQSGPRTTERLYIK